MRVIITGANGFVGSHLIQYLADSGIETIGWTRRPVGAGAPGDFVVGRPESEFGRYLDGVDAVIHAAGVAHRSGDSGEEMRSGNAEWTKKIVESVKAAETRALIHISSIAAAETTRRGSYAESKRIAEQAVNELPGVGKLGVNLRPPLIYGSGAKGNWPKLVALARSPVPLPFGSVANRRSFLGISNLCALVGCILDRIDQPDLSGTFPVADDDLVSLREIVGALRKASGRKKGLFPFPAGLLDRSLRILGKSTMADGLFQDLKIDSSEAKRRFNWSPGKATLPGMVESLNPEAPNWT